MKNKLFNTPKLKFLYSLLLFLMASLTLFRLIFLGYFHKEIIEGSSLLLVKSLLLGFRFDLRLSMLLLIPAILVINFPFKTLSKMRFLNVFYTLLFGMITFLYITDAGYFAYLKQRLNATVIQFLKNPMISFEMVRQTYPWPLFLLLIIFFMVMAYFVLSRLVTPMLETWHSGNKKDKFLSITSFILVFALGVYGSLKWYPLRWSEAFISPDPFVSNLSLNPILYVADTYNFKDIDFDEKKVIEAYPLVAEYLGIEKDSKEYDPTHLNFIRSFPGNPQRMKDHPNVVVIIMESMGYYKTGLGGSKVNPTPNLDKLASESLLFTKFYTPTVATARSVFAAVTSLPDLTKPNTSGSRNPYIVNQHTTIGELTGYEKYYFLGGSASWGNIRGVLSYNIPGLKIHEEGSYKSPRVDVWGISDLNLMKESFEILNERDHNKPFFALIQSSGFHRPYTIPHDNDDFKVLTEKELSKSTVQSYGFDSMDDYNAMRLQDYALGRFFQMVKKTKWYDNTIFLVFGDHSLPANNALNTEEWERPLSNGFHVPLVVHSPKYIKTGIETKIASEMDVMPTIAGLTGIPYHTRSLGRDLFNPKYDKYRAAFSYNWSAPFNLALIDNEHYFEYIPYNGHGKLNHVSSPTPNENVREQFPEKYDQMLKLSKGLYETAKYLLHHNAHLY